MCRRYFILLQEKKVFHTVSICANAFNVNIGTLRADLGLEFVSYHLKYFCKSKGIRQEFAATHTSMQNGHVERANRTIGEAIKSMLLASGMHSRFWGESAATYTYVHNLLPSFAGKSDSPSPQFSLGEKVVFWT